MEAQEEEAKEEEVEPEEPEYDGKVWFVERAEAAKDLEFLVNYVSTKYKSLCTKSAMEGSHLLLQVVRLLGFPEA